jgi:hypothetical protein
VNPTVRHHDWNIFWKLGIWKQVSNIIGRVPKELKPPAVCLLGFNYRFVIAPVEQTICLFGCRVTSLEFACTVRLAQSAALVTANVA